MIIVTGSLAFDTIMDFDGKFGDHIMPDKIHQINLSFLVNNLSKKNGGTAGNIAYNLALLGTDVSIVGAAGNDFSDYKKFLDGAGVDTSYIKTVSDKPTASVFAMTDKADNQISAFYPGAMSENSSLILEGNPQFVVISPNDPKAMINFTKECQEKKIPYMMDPGMQLPALDAQDLKSMINGATILIGNDYEIALLSSKIQIPISKLIENVKILITTLGEKGSTIQTKDETIQIAPGKPNEVLDPTGAGDAYRAGFLAGYMQDLSLQICGQMGSIASCFAIEKYGTTSHTFSKEEFDSRYKENFG